MKKPIKKLIPILSLLLLTACIAGSASEPSIPERIQPIYADVEPFLAMEIIDELTEKQFAQKTPVSGNQARDILSLVNAEREEYGLAPLSWNDNFALTANIRAEEITGFFSYEHLRPDGRQWYTAIYDSGLTYNSAGENIARGGHSNEGGAWYTPEMVMNDWMNSPGHRANILNGGYKYLGVAVLDCCGTRYYVQHFAS